MSAAAFDVARRRAARPGRTYGFDNLVYVAWPQRPLPHWWNPGWCLSGGAAFVLECQSAPGLTPWFRVRYRPDRAGD